jgi:hypothetical protein
MILNVCERWETILKGLDIDVNDWNTIEAARESELVVNLGLSEAQILLIQMAGTSHISNAP